MNEEKVYRHKGSISHVKYESFNQCIFPCHPLLCCPSSPTTTTTTNEKRETTNDERRHSRRRRICIHAHRAVEAQPHSATEEALGFACQDDRAGRRTRLLAFHPRSKSLGSRIRSGIRCFFRCRALSGKLSLIELSLRLAVPHLLLSPRSHLPTRLARLQAHNRESISSVAFLYELISYHSM